MATDCTHGFVDPRHCGECIYEGNVTPNRVTATGHPFTAKFPGDCALCAVPVKAGDMIWRRSDGSYIHYHHAPRQRGNRP